MNPSKFIVVKKEGLYYPKKLHEESGEYWHICTTHFGNLEDCLRWITQYRIYDQWGDSSWHTEQTAWASAD